MIKEINYTGLSSFPSDMAAPDGELAMVVNGVNENAAIRNAGVASTVFDEGTANYTDTEPYYIHRTYEVGEFSEKFIMLYEDVYGDNHVGWRIASDVETLSITTITAPVVSISSVGNTLIIVCEDHVHYAVWKPEDSAAEDGYLYLGTKLPELSLSFALGDGEVKKDVKNQIIYDTSVLDPDYYYSMSDEVKSQVTNVVRASLNKLFADITSDGHFAHPFFVRYAYRLYDGTLTMHSAPILMTASAAEAARVFATRIVSQVNQVDIVVTSAAVSSNLMFRANGENTLDKWKDIISSIDLFISPPIYTYDNNALVDYMLAKDSSVSYEANPYFTDSKTPLSYTVGAYGYIDYNVDLLEGTPRYQMVPLTRRFKQTDALDITNLSQYPYFELPKKAFFKEEIRDMSRFYHVKSYGTDEVPFDKFSGVELSKETLENLQVRELMTDDYDSHDELIPRQAFHYNGRVAFAGIKKKMFNGYDKISIINYTNGIDKTLRYVDVGQNVYDVRPYYIYYFIRNTNGEYIVTGEEGTMAPCTPITYLYHPNRGCYKAVVGYTEDDGSISYYEVKMQLHKLLNGAVYFEGWGDIQYVAKKLDSFDPTKVTETVFESLPHKLYLSEVYNPFVFDVKNISTIGAGEIYAVSTAAKPLSQGQFGQFPLYAFTSEGVWAVEVSDTGTFTPRQPITADICKNAKSITQIDNAVVFAVDRGLILLSGVSVECITDNLYPELFQTGLLPKFPDLKSLQGWDGAMMPVTSFVDYINGCTIAYDYANQQIVVSGENRTYAFVYSLRSKRWGTMDAHFDKALNSYPKTYVVEPTRNVVYDLGKRIPSTKPTMVLTRPLKFDAPHQLKTIHAVVQRGVFTDSNLSQALYGSNDMKNWFLVATAKGRFMQGFTGAPFKYHIVQVSSTLAENEYLDGCSIDYDIRFNNRLR